MNTATVPPARVSGHHKLRVIRATQTPVVTGRRPALAITQIT
jgi:hypothetical protein